MLCCSTEEMFNSRNSKFMFPGSMLNEMPGRNCSVHCEIAEDWSMDLAICMEWCPHLIQDLTNIELGLLFKIVDLRLFRYTSAGSGDNGPPIGSPSEKRYIFLLNLHIFLDTHSCNRISNSLMMSWCMFFYSRFEIMRVIDFSIGIFVYIETSSLQEISYFWIRWWVPVNFWTYTLDWSW